ncbi:SPOSA6832_05076, partial [Sporobolomyces salmonicolor]
MARLARLVASVLFLVFASLATAFKHTPGSAINDASHFVPNSFILEVDGSASGLSKRGLTLSSVIDTVLNDVTKLGIACNVRQTFTTMPEVFSGLSVRVAEGTTLQQLLEVEGVKNVWPVRLLKRPKGVTVGDAGSSEGRSAAVFASSPSSSRLSKRATDFPPASAYAGDTFGPHVQSGVNKLHDKGILGKGVKIAVLDDGVDYTNPILGGCFGGGCHISFGYDLVGDNYTGSNTPIPDADPFTNCSSHGTHVTGIIGALANEYGFSGVAPAATLGMYRVLGCIGDAGEDVLVAGMMRAYHDGANVISMSLAGGVGWLDVTPSQILTEYLTAQGVHVLAANGNEGTEGMFFTDSPAATIGGTSVGSVDVEYYPAYSAPILGHPPMPYMSPMPFNLTDDYFVYFTSTNTSVPNDACDPLPSSTPDLSNKVVIVQRGTCDFTVKQANVAAAGGTVLLIYNSQGSLAIPELDVGTSGLAAVGSLRYEDGLTLLSYYNTNTRSLRMTFPFGPLVPYVADTVSGGVVSTYSNYGPTNELFLMPSLVAPGLNILSTVPGGLGIMRGSSMSTPFVSGATALLLSARSSENLTPAQAKSLLMTTSSLAPTTVNGSTYSPVVLQGAGLVQVDRAIHSKTLIEPSMLLLNDTAYLNKTQNLRLTNRNDYPVTYTLSWQNAQGVVTYNDGAHTQILPSTEPDSLDKAVALRVAFSSRSVVVPPQESVVVIVTITPPNLVASDIDKFPIYSGWVDIKGRGMLTGIGKTEKYTVPFFGLAAKMIDMPILDTTDYVLGVFYPFVALGQDISTGMTTYSKSDPPTVYFRMAAGSRRLTLDLVDANIDYNATVASVTNPNMRRLAKRSASELVERSTPLLYNDVPTYGTVYEPASIPARDYLLNFSPTPYSDYELVFNGTYTEQDGTSVTAASGVAYRLLLRALKITADADYSDSYESWLSPPFQFKA